MPTARWWLCVAVVVLVVAAGCLSTFASHSPSPGAQKPSGGASTLSGRALTEPSPKSAAITPSLYLNCQTPYESLYDSGANEVFVLCEGSNNVTVISPTNDAVVAIIPLGYGTLLGTIAYDAGKGEVFVADYNNSVGNTVSVISDSSNSLIVTIPVGQAPGEMIYDPARGEMFVGNGVSNNISVISDTTNKVVATIALGYSGLALDPSKGELFVSNWACYCVYAVSDSTDGVVATIPVGNQPGDPVYDSAKGEVFVPNFQDADVSVISDASHSVVATVPVGIGPGPLLYDSGKGEVFVSNFWSGTVSVISDTTNARVTTIPTGPDPSDLTYVGSEGKVYLESIPGANGGGRNLSVISDSTNSIVASIPAPFGTYGAAYDPLTGVLFVPTGVDNISLISTSNDTVFGSIKIGTIPPQYSISFFETGLSPGASWRIDFPYGHGDLWGVSTSSAEVFYDMGNGSRSYDVSTTEVGVSPTIPSGTVVVKGADVTMDVTFVTAYQAAFAESGLPTNTSTSWNITFSGLVSLANASHVGPFDTTRSSLGGSPLITIDLPNGTYAYTAQASGYVSVSGSLSINGSSPPSTSIDFKTAGVSAVPVWLLAVALAISVGVIVAIVVVIRRHRKPRTPLPWESPLAPTTPPRTP